MKRFKRLWSLDALLYLALVLALVSSLGHVAFAFSTVNGDNWNEAYLSAVAIDVGLLALAAGINQRKKQNRDTKWLWAGVVFFSVISTYANWLAGLAHVKPMSADVGEIAAWLVTLRPILLSAVLPALVIYLSEIVSSNYAAGQDRQALVAAGVAEPVQASPDNPAMTNIGDTLSIARDIRQATIDDRRQTVAAMLNAGRTAEDIAGELGVSVRTVKRDTSALNGQVRTRAL